jgi:hypothetical protein
MVNVTAWSRTARVAAAMTAALAAPRHIGPCSSSTAPAPGIGAIVPHLGAVLPSSRSGQAGYHAT